MAIAMVRGMQNGSISLPTSVAACGIISLCSPISSLMCLPLAKHYFGYSDPKSGKDRTPAWVWQNHTQMYRQ